MYPEKRFADFCTARGYKNTGQRRALVGEIFKLNQAFTVNSLLAAVESKGFLVSRATVCRTLRILEEAQMVRKHDETYNF